MAVKQVNQHAVRIGDNIVSAANIGFNQKWPAPCSENTPKHYFEFGWKLLECDGIPEFYTWCVAYFFNGLWFIDVKMQGIPQCSTTFSESQFVEYVDRTLSFDWVEKIRATQENYEKCLA